MVGGALLLQAALAPLIYFRLLVPGTSPGFLASAAVHVADVRLALQLMFVASGLTIAIAVVAHAVFDAASRRLTLLYVGLAVAAAITIVAEMVAIRDMLALSADYVKAGAPAATLEVLGGLARRHRTVTHFSNLTFAHAAVLVMWIILYRGRLVPRLLAGYGILSATISTSAMALTVTGASFSFTAIQPLAIAMVLLVAWLLWKGFPETTGIDVKPAAA